MAKRGLCMFLAVLALFSLAVPALAQEEPVEGTEEPVVTEEPVIEPETEAPAAEPETAAVVTGTYGDNVQWTLDGTTLTISGTGEMDGNRRWSPWDDYYIEYAVIEPGVTNIGAGAFYEVASLKSVTIPDSVTSIGDDAFYGCTSLKSVTIPGSVTSIGDDAFCGCSSLAAVTISDGVTSIGNSAFAYCEALSIVAIPDSVTRIGYYAFNGCTFLRSLTIGNGVTTIGASAFTNCVYLNILKIPGNVTTIESQAFLGCTSLNSLTIENGVERIGVRAFYGCTALTSVTLPESVSEISQYAFYGCSSLTRLIIQNPSCYINSNSATLGNPLYTVIYADTGSKARSYAEKNGYTFRSIDQLPTPTPVPTPLPQLAAPAVTISQASDGIKVSWNKVTGAPRYMVYYKEGSGSWKKIGTTTATTYTRKAANLKNGVTYTFTVRCCANDKKTLLGPYKASNALKYTAQLAAPTVKIAKVSGGIKVSWNKITGSPRYMVYYKEGTGSWKKIGTTTATSYTRAAKYLKNNVTYTFTVRCCANDKKTLLGPYKASNSLKYTK